MTESSSNIGFNATCKPDPKLAQRKPSWFIGKFAKVPFKHDEGVEWMWVRVQGVEGKSCVGKLDNDPICFASYDLACGDDVMFAPAEVAEVIQGESQ